MSPEECWNAALVHALANAHMAFAIPVSTGGVDLVQFQSLNLDDALSTDFRILVERFRTELLGDSGQKRVIAFTYEYKPDVYDVEWISTEDALIKAVLDVVPPLISIGHVANLEAATSDARFYSLIFETETGERLLFLRRFERNKIMSQSKNLIIRAMGDRYSRLDEPTLQIDGRFDVVIFRGHVFVLHKNNFLEMFRYYEGLKRLAGNVVQSIVEHVPIANADAFREKCLRSRHVMSKLKNIAQKAYFRDVTMSDLKSAIAANNLKIATEIGADGVERLVFDSSRRWDILHLLDDRYLKSEMTSTRYEANSKRELG